MDEKIKEKQSLQEQFNTINSILIESKKFMPYDYNALVLWGVIASFLFLYTDTVINSFSIYHGIGFLVSFIVIGFIIEVFMIKRENKKFELEQLTKKQKFIEMVFSLASLFCIILTFLFIQNNLTQYLYLHWLFVLGFGTYVSGFVLNQKRFSMIGYLNMIVFILLFGLSFFIDIFELSKYSGTLFIGGGFIYLGIMGRKDNKLV